MEDYLLFSYNHSGFHLFEMRKLIAGGFIQIIVKTVVDEELMEKREFTVRCSIILLAKNNS